MNYPDARAIPTMCPAIYPGSSTALGFDIARVYGPPGLSWNSENTNHVIPLISRFRRTNTRAGPVLGICFLCRPSIPIAVVQTDEDSETERGTEREKEREAREREIFVYLPRVDLRRVSSSILTIQCRIEIRVWLSTNVPSGGF